MLDQGYEGRSARVIKVFAIPAKLIMIAPDAMNASGRAADSAFSFLPGLIPTTGTQGILRLNPVCTALTGARLSAVVCGDAGRRLTHGLLICLRGYFVLIEKERFGVDFQILYQNS